MNHYVSGIVGVAIGAAVAFLLFRKGGQVIQTSDLERLKVFLVYYIVSALFVLAVVSMVGRIEESTSAGLKEVLGSLQTLAGGAAVWVFTTGRTGNGQPKE